MTIGLNMLFNAIVTFDVVTVESYLSTNPELFEDAAKAWRENPLLVACKHRSSSVAVLIARKFPKFAKEKNREGDTALHLASAKGLHEVAEVLFGLHRHVSDQLCLAKDRISMIPLQAAIENGHVALIKLLIAACPHSIEEVTSRGDTVFHLAVKKKQFHAFQFLLEVITEQNREDLLHKKDRKGDNILHIATSTKQIQIVKLLLRTSVRVNSLNRRERTALDLCNGSDKTILDIRNILRGAGAVNRRELPLGAYFMDIKQVLLVVLALAAGAAFTTVCNLPSSFHKDNHGEGAVYHTADVIFGNLPLILYLMVFNTAVLLVCMVAIVFLLWSLPCRPVVLFVTFNVSVVYDMLVCNIMPKFVVRVGTHDIWSSHLVGLLAVLFICFAAIAYQVACIAGSLF